MNDSDVVSGMFFGFLIVFALNVFFNVSDGVYPADFQKATIACGDVGVKKVYRPEYVGQRFQTTCNDGREIWMDSEAKNK